jgi:hypothetical protein
MSAPKVDVLAVWDRMLHAAHVIDAKPPIDDEANAARAAVAELIEAACFLDKAVRDETEHLRAHNFADISQCDEHKKFESRVVEANERLRAALANIGPQS